MRFFGRFSAEKIGKLLRVGFFAQEASVQADATDACTHTNPSQAQARRARSAGPHRLQGVADEARVKQPRGGSLSAIAVSGSTARSRAHARPTPGLPAASRELI